MSEPTNKFNFNELNTLAVISLASAVSLFGAPAAVITGHVALQQLKTSGQKGRWMALVGVALGYLGIASAILFTIIAAILRFRYGHYLDCTNMGGYSPMCYDYRYNGPEPMPDPSLLPMPGTN